MDKYIRRGKKLTKKTIVRDYRNKLKNVETKLYHSPPKNVSTTITGSSILSSSSLDPHDQTPSSSVNPSLEVNQPSLVDEIPKDRYYPSHKNAPLFVRPVWRRRRPMVAQNKWRRRPTKKNSASLVDSLQKQRVLW
jgi:hypothetical protein